MDSYRDRRSGTVLWMRLRNARGVYPAADAPAMGGSRTPND
jgi:hypothetical protein